MKSMIDLYIGQLAAEEKSLETLKQYGGVLRRFESWLASSHSCSISSDDISKITGVMLTEYYQYLFTRGLSIATRNNYVVIIRDFFEFLTQVNIIQTNPSAVLHCVKGKKIYKQMMCGCTR